MAGILQTLASTIGVAGKRKYETESKIPPFAGRTLKEKLQTIVLEKRTADRMQRIRRHTHWYVMALYYQGFQNVDLTSDGSSFEIYDREDFYVENQFRKHVDTVRQILNRMEGDVIVRPISDAPRDLTTARVADPILEMQRNTVDYPRLLDEKNLFKCLFGNAFIFTDYIQNKKYGSIVTPKFSYEEMPGPDGDLLMTKTVNGYESRFKGRQIATVCSPLEVNCPVDIRPFTETPYLQWISRQDIEILNYLYPGLSIHGGMSSVEVDLAQQYLDILSNLPGHLFSDSLAMNRGSSHRKKAELVRSWLQPCTFQGDKELEREFPDGAHVTTVNGKVVDFYNEDLTERWTHEVLIPAPHSLLGDGLYDAIQMQDQINEVDSLIIKHMRYSTVGHKLYDSSVFDPKDVINDPENGWIPGKPGLDKSITQCAIDLSPNALSTDVPAWKASLLQSMQDMTGAYDPVTGKGIGANTPYSQSVFLAERAQQRWASSLAFNRPEMIRFNKQLLEDFRNNATDEVKQAVIDNAGQWSFQTFSSADLQGDVDIYLSNADFKPRSRAEQVQGLQMLTQLAPIIPFMPPKQKLRIEEMLGLPQDANPMSNQISRAYRMIDRIMKGETVTPLVLVDDASAQVPVFQDFLVSDKGEALAESDPEAYANIHTYMTSLLMQEMMQMASPGGMMAKQIQGGGQSQQKPPAQGSPPGQPGTPGGQPGQAPGGSPNPGGQAQSPAVAPPIPPSEAANRGQQ